MIAARMKPRSMKVPRNVVIVAMANKIARIAWAVLTRGQVYSAIAST
jgi:transposase